MRRRWLGIGIASTTCSRTTLAISPLVSSFISIGSSLVEPVVEGGSSRPSTTSSWTETQTERRGSGSSRPRTRTRPSSTSELVDRYCIEQGTGRHHRVLLVGLFALDFLTIHPFVDGNGRLSRLLSTRLLSQVGYGVGRYVSLEGVIYERRNAYYDALAASTAGWQDSMHDPWPWLSFFVEVVADAYEAFAARADDHRIGRAH